MVGLLHAMAFMVLLLIGWVIWNDKLLPFYLASTCIGQHLLPFWRHPEQNWMFATCLAALLPTSILKGICKLCIVHLLNLFGRVCLQVYLIWCASSSNFFIVSLQMSDAFSNLRFSSIIECSCMMATSCNSCWCIASVVASHQYCFCVVKKSCVQCVQTKHTKK